jgi:hypothetical protein
MLEPAPGIRVADSGHGLGNRGVERRPRARLRLAQGRFELRPTGFDGRQVGRVGRQIAPPRPTTGNGLLDANGFVRSQMIHHNHIARAECGTQYLLDIGAKHLRVSRTVDGCQR